MMISDGDCLKALVSASFDKASAIGEALVVGDCSRPRPAQIARRMHLKIAAVEMRAPVHG